MQDGIMLPFHIANPFQHTLSFPKWAAWTVPILINPALKSAILKAVA